MILSKSRLVFGILLITGGLLFLLDNLGIVAAGGYFIAALFAAAGIAFLYTLLQNHSNWWAAIPGTILLALGFIIAIGDLAPGFSNVVSGPLFLAAIGLSFWIIYFMVPTFWWAVIPGGVMFTLAVVASLRGEAGLLGGGIFFLGLAATFASLRFLPSSKYMKWPWIPATVLGIMGVLMLFSAVHWFIYIWPVLLILGGGWLVWKTAK
jgi:hypothetical protein